MATGTQQFGAPMDDVQDPAALDPELAQTQETLDINDPAFTSEPLAVNVEGDAYAFPPLPPEGKYRVKLKHMKVKNAAGQPVDCFPARWGKTNPQLVLVTGVEAAILDPSGKYDGIKAYDRNMSTFLSPRDSSTKIQSILRLLKQPNGQPWIGPGTQLHHKGWMDLFMRALSGEPELGAMLVWRWNCQGCGEAAKKAGEAYPKELKGMNKFPVDAAESKKAGHTVYSSEKKCDVNMAHGYSRANLEIGSFFPVSEIGK